MRISRLLPRIAAMPAALVLISAASVATAEPLGVAVGSPASPRDDAADLANLAPPSNAATSHLTYGDAGFAKRQRRVAPYGERGTRRGYVCLDDALALRPPCPPGTALRRRELHVLAPSYVSAPQVFDDVPREPTPLRSSFVQFFFDPFR